MELKFAAGTTGSRCCSTCVSGGLQGASCRGGAEEAEEVAEVLDWQRGKDAEAACGAGAGRGAGGAAVKMRSAGRGCTSTGGCIDWTL
mmetsp:Transcript_97160/g.274823  ORF Transcript_97160/g.274823 Transcript_97160/m.274823 type:complete len:88 (-) Transcript_97160:292-555(-)